MTGAIDTHIHLDRLSDLRLQLEEARREGISRWVVPGVDPADWGALAALTGLSDGIYLAPGIHPESASLYTSGLLEALCQLMTHPKAVAIGEVGLDDQVDVDRRIQEQVFVEMIRLAKALDKPLLIHSRKRTERILDLLQQEKAGDVGGIFHAFSGSVETARKVIDQGFLLGIGGVVTWPTARKLPEVVRHVSPESLVVETDAPYMTPASLHGQPNRAASLTFVIEKVAALRGWSVDETVKVTTKNAERIFRLSAEVNQ